MNDTTLFVEVWYGCTPVAANGFVQLGYVIGGNRLPCRKYRDCHGIVRVLDYSHCKAGLATDVFRDCDQHGFCDPPAEGDLCI